MREPFARRPEASTFVARRGVALVVVLGLLVALGALTAEIARAVRLEAHTVASLRARTVARYAAESGVVLAEQRLRALLDSVTDVPERVALLNERDGWLAPLREVALGDARFGVAIADLNARLDLNRSDSVALRNLFARYTSAGQAAAVVRAIREAPLARLGELSSIPGVDAALALAVAPFVTVSGDGAVNVNSAPEPVLAAIPALGEAGARHLLQRRESGEVFAAYGDLRLRTDGAPSARLDAVMMPTRLLVVSRGWQSGHPLTHEIQAVYGIVGSSLKLLRLEERDR